MCGKSFTGYLFLTILLISVTAIINAGSTGKIMGRLTDAKTGDPVVGASVIVLYTIHGTTSGDDGRYAIEQLKPGTCSVQITHLDYSTITVTDVVVEAGIDTDVSQQLHRKVTDLGVEINIKGEQEKLKSREACSEVKIPSVSNLWNPPAPGHEPKPRVVRVAADKEGKVFVRGGRAFEVAYVIDGTPLNDPLGGLGQPGAHLRFCGPAHGGNAIVNGEPFDAMFFENYGVNPFVDTEDDHLSTFAIDVDDASFILARSYLYRGAMPNQDAVRTEEFVNHFVYNYEAPHKETFRLHFEGSPSKFGQNCQMLRIGIKGLEVAPEERKPANLVFVVDVSGSMGRENRLALVRQALRLLLDELTDQDRVGICVYGTRGRVVLEPIAIKHKHKIVEAIECLYPEGATNAEEGIRLGYEMADRCFEQGKINRIILCSDGVANVGRTGPDDILKMIKRYADKGITLSSIGFGMGNHNEVLLEKLGNKGNGSYAYVNDLAEARRIFVDNLTGNLQVIARDVKIQVDFNPDVVRSYRLLGYENRDVDDDKFRDDKEDGGEVGAGYEVTALYEIKFREYSTSDRVGTIFVRYKDPDDMEEVTEISRDIEREVFAASFDNCSSQFRLAACAAEFAEILRKSYWGKGSTLDDVLTLAKELVYENESEELIEFLGLISKARKLEQQLAER